LSNLGLEFPAPTPARTNKNRVPIGRMLVDAGVIQQPDLLCALAEQRYCDAPLGELLIARHLLSEDDVTQALAAQHHLQLVDLNETPPRPDMAGHMNGLDCLKFGVVPWSKLGKTILVATDQPDRFDDVVDRLARAGNSYLPVVARKSQINQQISALYGQELACRAGSRVALDESCRIWQGRSHHRSGWAIMTLAILASLAMWHPAWTFTVLILGALLTSIMTVTLRSLAFFAKTFLSAPPEKRSRLGDIPRSRLPKVSVLVPLFQEEEIATALIARLSRLRYPKALLQIVLVLEEGDTLTRDTIARTTLPPWFEVIEVPQAGRLRTKPRALNYALDFCSGTIIGVWDAEDAPEIDQIDRVVEYFAQAPDDIACVQGVLDYYNARTNWISRCFTIEYAAWWRVVLPGIARLGMVIPLGGTTLFFRRDILEQLRGWDAHNVTEDADLGVRLARHGFKTTLMPTVTYEEANFRAWPWIKQRSRWLKGFLITWCVHMRAPRRLIKEVGVIRFIGIQTLFFATFSQFIAAPLLWSFCLTFAGMVHPIETTLGTGVLMGLFSFFVFAELLNIAIALKAVSGTEHRHLLPWAVTLPIYFILGTFAAYKALYEFIVIPFYWDKTQHGLGQPPCVSGPTPSTSLP
jgi:cellulose synthase/poly-beta-1,6-N-acetylglucosamine synthase-like glycosyltransferase